MSMPKNLILVRHGQSESNLRQESFKNDDFRLNTEEFMTVPDRSWRLTDTGREQASCAGEWISKEFSSGIDRYFVSPFTRTRETAACLNLSDPRWEENRVIRERSWGEIDSIPLKQFAEEYPQNAILKKKDPLYWTPPAGESIASVADNRVRNLLSTLHRENEEENVLLVTHGEFMWAMRLILERWSDEEYLMKDSDPQEKIYNCTVFHYSRVNPVTNEVSRKLNWVRKSYPKFNNETNSFVMEESDWIEFDTPYLSNSDLLERVNTQTQRIH